MEGKGAYRIKHTARGELISTGEVLSQTDLETVANELASLRMELYKDWFPKVRGYADTRMPHDELPRGRAKQ
jgi:hypothetical protein